MLENSKKVEEKLVPDVCMSDTYNTIEIGLLLITEPETQLYLTKPHWMRLSMPSSCASDSSFNIFSQEASHQFLSSAWW